MRARWALFIGLALAPAGMFGCGKGRTPRLPEMSLPPKPSPQQIAEARKEVREPEPAPLFPPLPSLMELPAFKEWGVRETAADALARIGTAAVPALIDALHDPNPDVRSRAAGAIARMGPPAKEAVPNLIVALADPDWKVRRSAARALGQIGAGAAEAVPALIDVIRNPASDANGPAGATKS